MNHADYLFEALHTEYNKDIIPASSTIISIDLENKLDIIILNPPEGWSDNLAEFLALVKGVSVYIPLANNPSFMRDTHLLKNHVNLKSGIIVPRWLADKSGQGYDVLEEKTYLLMHRM